MIQSATIPVTVKCRIGVDDEDSELQLDRFVETVSAAGCRTFIIHARKAWLQGLSPKQNREVPPLDYSRVYRLKRRFGHLEIVINGGVTSLDEAETHLGFVDGVMMGRSAYSDPYLLSEVDRRFFQSGPCQPSREFVLERYLAYCKEEVENGCSLGRLARHVAGLFRGQPGARRWRRYLSEHANEPQAGVEIIRRASQALFAAAREEPVPPSGRALTGISGLR